MAYTALYRKYRPETFSQVVGQEHVVISLRNQVRSGHIGHAYLFCGTRGTGKTSLAKILARAVNCENPQDGDPCGTCRCCTEASSGVSMNVVEIDAASNNGVDNIREIRSEVAYPPTRGRYRVYIIDEVHMLSVGAFNALLKTLEEPPSHVIFILATTEPQKVPATILSRCQRYDFHRLSQEEISGRVMQVLREEGIEAEEKAVRYIARKAEGGMRDALSLTDQCISFYMGQQITYEKVLDILGAVDSADQSLLLRQIIRQDPGEALTLVDRLVYQGRDIAQLVTDFIWYLRNLLMVKVSEKSEESLDVPEETRQQLLEEAGMVGEDMLMRYIRELSSLANQLRYASNRRVLLEISIIRMCRPQMENDRLSVLQRLQRLEEAMEQGKVFAAAGAEMISAAAPVSSASAGIGAAQPEAGTGKNDRAALPDAVPEDIQQIRAVWKSIISDVSSVRFRATLEKAELKFSTAPGMENMLIVVFPDFLGETWTKSPEQPAAQLAQLIGEKTGKNVQIRFMIAGDHAVDQSQMWSVDRVLEKAKMAINMDIEIDEE